MVVWKQIFNAVAEFKLWFYLFKEIYDFLIKTATFNIIMNSTYFNYFVNCLNQKFCGNFDSYQYFGIFFNELKRNANKFVQ